VARRTGRAVQVDVDIDIHVAFGQLRVETDVERAFRTFGVHEVGRHRPRPHRGRRITRLVVAGFLGRTPRGT